MIKEEWFAVPIWYDIIEDIDIEPLIKEILKMETKMPSVEYSNVGGWQSESNIYEYPTFKPLFEKLQPKVEKAAKEYTGNSESSVELINAWINVSRAGNYNRMHSHPGCNFSAVFYLTAPDEKATIKFVRPDFNLISGYEIYGFSNSVNVVDHVAVPKKLLIFPSWIPHEVEINNSNNPRISIAVNYASK